MGPLAGRPAGRGLRCAHASRPSAGTARPRGPRSTAAPLRCVPPGTRELSPAVRAAWQAFFTDAPGPGGVGMQTRYVRMLRQVARRFARSTAVAGFDVMNEPNAIGDAQQAALSRLLRARARARSVPASGAGTRAPPSRALRAVGALVGVLGNGAPPDFERDRDVVYAPHIYTGGFTNGPIGRGRLRHRPPRGPALRRRPRALRRVGHRPAPARASRPTATSCATRRSRTRSG